MAIVFITGSTDGLGRAAAQSLLDDGHQVVLHARSTGRAATIAELASRSAGIVVGDLRSAAEVRSIADQVNAMGRMDAIIHNAGVYTERSRSPRKSQPWRILSAVGGSGTVVNSARTISKGRR
jgi:NAD(P)-dependent dehydrogenase (short-subunit alcohol dehydrogenase family)